MSDLQHLREQLRETVSAIAHLAKVAAEHPDDPVALLNLNSIKKRKSILERRVALELQSTDSQEATSLEPAELAEHIPLWREAPQLNASEIGRFSIQARHDPTRDATRLMLLHPLLQTLSGELLENLRRTNRQFPVMREHAETYNRLISQGLNKIDFIGLFLEGQRLQSAVNVLEQAEGELADSRVLECALSLLVLHEGFVRSSNEVAALVDAMSETIYSREILRPLYVQGALTSKAASASHEIASSISSAVREIRDERASTREVVVNMARHVAGTFSASIFVFSLSAFISGSITLGAIGGIVAAGLALWAIMAFSTIDH
jgi:hypothetical protein